MKTNTETPTTRPLAERITQGPVRVNQNPSFAHIAVDGDGVLAKIRGTFTGRNEDIAHAEILVEAINVTHETGRTPRQLAEERAELIRELSALVETFHREAPACSPGYTYPARQLLSNLTL